MAGANVPFNPSGNVTAAAGTASVSVALAGAGDTVLVTNLSGVTAFVAFGTSGAAVATVSAGFPIPAGSSRLLSVGSLTSFAAVILATGAGSVVFSLGVGDTY